MRYFIIMPDNDGAYFNMFYKFWIWILIWITLHTAGKLVNFHLWLFCTCSAENRKVENHKIVFRYSYFQLMIHSLVFNTGVWNKWQDYET